MKERIIGITFAFALVGARASADDARPVTVNVKEREPGAFLVQWQVPQVLPLHAMPVPVLPESCSPEGERTVIDRGVAWLNRQTYRCEDGLAGRAIGIRYPVFNPSLTTFLRVDFLSGERFAHVLGPTEESWIVPELDKGAVASALEGASRAVLAGIAHVLSSGADILFLLTLCLIGGLDRSLRLVGLFAGAQVLAVIAVALSGLSLAGGLREAGLAVAAVLLAAEALRGPSERRQIRGVVAAAGVVHGAGLSALVVLGIDAVMVALAIGITSVAMLMARQIEPLRIRRIFVYGVGGLAVASALALVFTEPVVNATAPPRTRLPEGASLTRAAALPGSRPLAPQSQDAPIQSFLSVEPFEVRHEVLVSLVALEGVVDDAFIEIEAQREVKQRIGELVLSSAIVSIDGETKEPVVDRIDFVTVGPKGVFPRTSPVREEVAEALLGVTLVYVTPRTPQEVALEWQMFVDDVSIPATVIDPESTRTTTLSPEQPALSWQNELSEDPTPTVAAVLVEPPVLLVPILSLLLLVLSGYFAFAAFRPDRSPLSMAAARVLLASAFIAGPLANVLVALPMDQTPSKEQARRILAGVLPNVYRAFESREESAAYDRLAVSVTGETLTDIYLEHRRALDMEERGGARARVEAVEVQEVRSVEPAMDGGFEAEASWTVGGTVTHFGHRHFRQNRYDTRVEVVPVDGTWKIRTVEVLEEERLR